MGRNCCRLRLSENRAATVSEAELDAHCLDTIARFKRPKEYRFVDSLPKNNYGKVLKTELRECFKRPFSREIKKAHPRYTMRRAFEFGKQECSLPDRGRRRSVHMLSAIDRNRRTGHELAVFAAKEPDSTGNFAWITQDGQPEWWQRSFPECSPEPLQPCPLPHNPERPYWQ